MEDKPIVKWEKWTNPFGIKTKDGDEVDEFTEENEVEEFDEDDFDLSNSNYGKSRPFAMITPVGVVPLNSTNNPLQFFNWWICKTSFPISPEEYDELNYIKGVETLDKFSAYRIRVGIAELCDEEKVRKSISDYLIKKQTS